MKHLPLLLTCLLPLVACGKSDDASAAKPAPAAAGPAEPMEFGHGEARPLGQLTLGAHTFEVVQFGDVTAGKEAVLDLKFAAGKPLPAALRGWVGIESGEGSMKARFAKEGESTLHNHVEVPKVLPAGSKLWFEIEENGQTARGSIAWK